MALNGTLNDFGISDIFQLIAQQQKTGVLTVRNKAEQVQVLFLDGKVVGAEDPGRRPKQLLGEMLVRADIISSKILEDALNKQKYSLKKLGDVLVELQAIDRPTLQQMALLQINETIYRLFSWKSGNYAFEAKLIDYDPEYVTPIRAESVLMEGFRQIDEWPAIRRKLTDASISFLRLRELPPSSPIQEQETAQGIDSKIDLAFDEAFAQESDSSNEKSGWSESERAIFQLANPGKSASWIIDHSRLGAFETSKALVRLVEEGYLDVEKPKTDANKSSLSRGDKLLQWLSRWTVGLALIALIGLMVTRARHSPFAISTDEYTLDDPAIQRIASRAQLARIHTSLETYALEKGSLPNKLEELGTAGILSGRELRYPWRNQYYYRKVSENGYILLPPVQ